MKNARRILSLAIILGLTSTVLAEPYSQTWEQSNSAPAVSSRLSSEYTLGWQDTQRQTARTVQKAEGASPVEAPVAVNLAALPNLIAAAQGANFDSSLVASAAPLARGTSRRLRGPSSVSVPTHDITLHAERYFDNYTDNYRLVNKVEVVTYRGGYPQTDTHWNQGNWNTYDVYINDLKPGDRYEIRVTWDDGSYRTLERSIDRYPDHVVRISKPL